MREWAAEESLWVRRAAILSQIGEARDGFDTGLLSTSSSRTSATADFFMPQGDRLGPARSCPPGPRLGARLRRLRTQPLRPVTARGPQAPRGAPVSTGNGDHGRDRHDVDERQRAVARRREILRLAVPAFLALIAEPLFLLVDAAIIGHLGTAELAGLGVASAALVTGAGIFVFLAYGTTSVVARHLGAGDERSAISAGVDGSVARPGSGHRRGCRRRHLGRAHLRGLRCLPRGARAGNDLPARVGPRPAGHARHPRRDRCAARPPGHHHAARRLRRRLHPQPRAQPLLRLRIALGHRRIRVGHRHRADQHGGRAGHGARRQGPRTTCPCARTRGGCSGPRAPAYRCSCAPSRCVRCCC